MFGDSLLSADGTVKTEDALKNKKVVAIYFSAHWCPPCRGFTPKLAEYYTADLKAKDMEIVFASSDSDEEAFKSYFKEMPWLALPYGEREMKEKLSKKFKVKGIPSFVILDGATGDLITTDGRSKVMEDPKGEDLPWKPKPLSEVLGDATFVNKEGTEIKFADLSKPYLGLYFSAHWCPPCKMFTPELAKKYSKLNENGLEIVFVSSDRDEDSFKEYYNEMPWLALPFADRKLKGILSNAIGVSGIPCLAILNKSDCSIVTTKGRSAVDADPEGAKLPWYPEPVLDLVFDADGIAEQLSVAALVEDLSKDDQEKVHATLTELSKEMKTKKSDDDDEIKFFIGKEAEGTVPRLRSFCKIENKDPVLLLLNLEEGEFLPVDVAGGKDGFAAGCTKDFIAASVAKLKAGELTFKTPE